MRIITSNIGFVVCNDDGERLGVFETHPQAEWFARTGESLGAAEAAFAQEEYMARLDTAKAIVSAVKTLSTVNDLGPDLVKEYFDAGAFVDADVVALGITAAQLGACITLLQQATFLMSGANDGAGHSTIAPADYTSTLNAVRRVVTG